MDPSTKPDLSGLEFMKNDPNFAKFSYDQQVHIRTLYVAQQLGKDPNFQALPMHEQEGTIKYLAFQPPVLWEPTERDQKFLELTHKALAGDQEAQDQVITKNAWDSFVDQLSIVSLVGNLVDEEWIDPDHDMSRRAVRYQRSLNDDKLNAWALQSLSGEVKDLRLARTAQTVAAIGGTLVDFIGGWVATGGIAGATATAFKASALGTKIGAYAAKYSGAGNAIKSQAARFFWQSALPEVSRSARGGLIGVVRHNLNGTLLQRIGEDPTLGKAIIENTKLFGAEFVQDYLMFQGISALKVAGRVGKFTFSPRQRVGQMIENADEANKVIDQWLFKQGLPDDQLANLTKEELDAVRLHLASAKRFKNVTELHPESPDFWQHFFRGKGYDTTIDITGKWQWKHIDTDDAFKSASNLKVLTKDIMKDFRKRITFDMDKLTSEQQKIFFGGAKEVSLWQQAEASISQLGDLDAVTATKFLRPIDGQVPLNNVKFYIKRAFDLGKVDSSDISIVKVPEKNYKRLVKEAIDKNDHTKIYVPENLSTGGGEINFYKGLNDQLQGALTSKGASALPSDFTDALNSRINKNIFDDGATPFWVDTNLQRFGFSHKINANQAHEVIDLATKEKLVFSSFDDLVKFTFDKALAEGGEDIFTWTQRHIAANYSGRLYIGLGKEANKALKDAGFDNLHYTDVVGVKRPGSIESILNANGVTKPIILELPHHKKGKIQRFHFASIEDLWGARPELVPPKPLSSMPPVFVDESLQKLIIKEGVLTGPQKAVLDFSRTFRDFKKKDTTSVLKGFEGGELAYDNLKREFVVRVDQFGVERKFATLTEAQSFIRKSKTTYDGLDEMAMLKGYRILLTKAGYGVYSSIDDMKVFSTKEALVKHIEVLPTQEFIGKELFDIDNALVDTLQQKFATYLSGQTFNETLSEIEARLAKDVGKKIGLDNALADFFAPADISLRMYAKKLGSKEYFDIFRNMENAKQDAYGRLTAFKKDYKQLTGRLNEDQRKLIGKVFQSGKDPSDWAKVWEDLAERPATTEELEVMRRIRKLFGETPEEGLWKLFDIDGYKIISEYFPRIRQNLASKKAIHGSEMKLTDYLRETNPGANVKDLENFASNMRTSDALKFSALEDIDEVMMHYVTAGLKTKFLNPVREQWRQLLKKAEKNKYPQEAIRRLNQYVQEATGMYGPGHQAAYREFSEKVTRGVFEALQKIGLDKPSIKLRGETINLVSPKMISDDLIGSLNNLTISATMSFRGWLPIRNAFQPLLTLAPRIGLDVTLKAMELAGKNADSLVQRMIRQGILPDHHPLAEMATGGNVGKLNALGMRAYKNSDAYTRATVLQAVDLMMDDSMERLTRGVINEKQFIDLSGLKVLDELDQKEILSVLKKGDYIRAKSQYAKILSDETMFPYRNETNPEMFKGIAGRIFGGFGTYPVHFVANIGRGLRRAMASKNYGDVIRFVGTYAATSSALYYGFKSVGINAQNFLFSDPIGFSGGPYYQVMTDIIDAAEMNDSSPGKIKAIFNKSRNILIPGFYAGRNLLRGMKSLSEGDYYGAVVNAMSAPYDDSFGSDLGNFGQTAMHLGGEITKNVGANLPQMR